jgi:hypothetical protein
MIKYSFLKNKTIISWDIRLFKVKLLILPKMTIVQKGAFVSFLKIMIYGWNTQFRTTLVEGWITGRIVASQVHRLHDRSWKLKQALMSLSILVPPTSMDSKVKPVNSIPH